MKSKLLPIAVAAITACSLFSGCGPLNSLTGTTASDTNPVNQLGPYSGLKHAVGCIDFENQGGWAAQWKLGNNLSIMLESALGATERFVLVEREQLGAVIAEQNLAGSARVAAAKKVAKTGLIRPARYLATGAVTEVTENQSGGTGGLYIKGFRLGGSKGKATVTVVAKLIDTTTGEIVAQQRVTGVAGKVGISVGMYKNGVGGNLGGFAKTPLSEAAQDCMNQAAVFIAKKMEKMPFEGSVVKASRKTVIINRGGEFGVEIGKELVMKTLGELLMDPDTGAILGREEGDEIGKLKVIKVTPKMSYCTVTSGEKKPKSGTPVYE
jgi:curli biogenesis system outer membrane secretion channel CsgG